MKNAPLRLSSSLSLLLVCAFGADLRAQNQPWLHAPLMLDLAVGELRFLGDVDLDGDLDALRFFSQNQSAILTSFTVMQNDGAGQLSVLQTVAFPAEVRDTADYGDVDGDGRGDLVIETLAGNPLGTGVLIYPGQANGTFGAPTHVALPGVVFDLEIGTGNGDGIGDIFVHHPAPGTVVARWLFGAPSGPPTLGPATVSLYYAPRVLLDANGDGLDDVAWAEGSGVQPSILRIEVTAPTGFSPHATVSLPPGFAFDLVALDHDGDGDDDLVCTPASTSGLTWVTITNAGAWTTSTQTFSGSSIGRMWAVDWDGDGATDVVQRGANTGSAGSMHRLVALFRSNGAGSFQRRFNLSIPGQTLHFGAGPGDVNLDGHPDFVDANAVVFGDGTANDPFGGAIGGELLDWEDDGDLDLFVGSLHRNDGRGVFAPRTITLPNPGPNLFYDTPHLVHDLDGDGRREMLVVLRQFVFPVGSTVLGTRLLRETADYTFVDAGFAAAAGVVIGAGVVDDADADGDLDVINQAGIWQNDGSEYFTLLGPGFAPYQPVATGDVDGDGDLDLLASTTTGGTSLAVLYRTGPATYTTNVLYPSLGGSIVTGQTPRFFDLDDDGDLDVAGLEQFNSTQFRTRLYENQGGVFSFVGMLPHGSWILVGDVDGYGMTDIAFYSDRLLVLRRIGPGLSYAAPVTFATPFVDRFEDIDQDGDVDAVRNRVVRNLRFHGPAAGQRRQYGEGGAGTGGRAPVLSVTGTIRVGDTPLVRLRNAPGGTLAVLVVGTTESNAPSLFLPGVHSYVGNIDLLLTLAVTGPLGQAGAGGVDLPVPIPVGAGGTQLFFEFLVLDGAVPNLLTYSNGCEFVVGQ